MKIKEIKLDDIIQFLSNHVGFDITKKNNKDEYARTRYYFYILSIKYSTDIVNPSVLSRKVNLTHGTVITGMNTIEEQISVDKRVAREWYIIEQKFIELFEPNTLDLRKNIELSKLRLHRKIIDCGKRLKYTQDEKNKLRRKVKYYKSLQIK